MLRTRLKVEKLIWKGHLYLGLFLLVGIWVFCLSGLLLNHPTWSISGFWENRQRIVEEQQFPPLATPDDNARALELVAALGLRGELDQVRSFPGGDSLGMSVVRPGEIVQVMAWPARGVARVESNRLGASGVLQMLHKFTGVRIGGSDNRRDWLITRLWSISIDIICIGLGLIVLSGLYFAFARREDFGLKLLSLGLGLAACAFFVFGLHWLP